MTSILKVDTIQDTDGNNIINESGKSQTRFFGYKLIGI